MIKRNVRIICPFCDDELNKHRFDPCLANLRYLTTGEDVREEGRYTKEESKKTIEEYRGAVQKGIGGKISLTEVCERVQTAIDEDWWVIGCEEKGSKKMSKLIGFFFKYYDVGFGKGQFSR